MTDAPPKADAVTRAREAFDIAFGRDPEWIGIAPGRVNLIGEHIDYCGGHVLPFAIDRVCAVAAAPVTRNTCRIFAADLNQSWSYPRGADLGALQREGRIPKGSWYAYVAGVLHHVGQALGTPPDLDLVIATDVPIGAGLSSSASLGVAVAQAANPPSQREGAGGWAKRAHNNPNDPASPTTLTPLTLAQLCQTAEHTFAGVPCGLMDQAAAALCREGHALLLDCREPAKHRHIRVPKEAAFLVVDTGVKHALGDGAYAKLRSACDSAARTLGVRHLCGARADADTSSLSADEQHAFQHATSENARVLEAVAAMEVGNLQRLGDLLNASHESLRSRLGVSCAELDCIADTAARVPGVYGARMTGAGFGGSAIVLVDPHQASVATNVVRRAFRTRFKADCRAFEVRASGGAKLMRV